MAPVRASQAVATPFCACCTASLVSDVTKSQRSHAHVAVGRISKVAVIWYLYCTIMGDDLIYNTFNSQWCIIRIINNK